MRFYYSWIQAETTNQRVPSYPPRCTTARDDRRIVRMTVTDRAATSRSTEQQIQSYSTYVSTGTIRRRSQQSGMSARRPFLRLSLTGNYRRLRRQWGDERRTWTTERNDIVFTDESRFCLQHNGIRVWRHRGERLNC
ncbi:transposable element Tcb1 transposase [Trichonephila clavipes]|nr:transposable element Tcb1 transposase [Trichonephila clavipes]